LLSTSVKKDILFGFSVIVVHIEEGRAASKSHH
jgi:hypothetical protein